MNAKVARAGLVWGTLLILLGVLSLLDMYVVELGSWVWILVLVASALLATGLYLRDRSDWGMLIAAYVLWAVAFLVLLVTFDILHDEAVAFYVLLAIALPFLAVWYRDRAQWWALIPAYVLTAVGLMVGLIGLGVLSELLVPAFVLLAIAFPFFVVYARDRSQWWSLIPGGVLAVIGLSFLIAEGALAIVGSVLLIGVGLWFLVRAFTHKDSPPDAPATTGPESDLPGEGHGE